METRIDKTNKTHQEVIGLKFMFKMSTIHTKHIRLNEYAIAQSLSRWWSGPAASTLSADVLSTSLHHGSANCIPSPQTL